MANPGYRFVDDRVVVRGPGGQIVDEYVDRRCARCRGVNPASMLTRSARVGGGMGIVWSMGVGAEGIAPGDEDDEGSGSGSDSGSSSDVSGSGPASGSGSGFGGSGAGSGYGSGSG
ncbi:hypothetical protein IQ07DRAFT_681972 [Pyrenochaeta sp. DS3sAY3a]|nr:hypothetical protein IQ07DRAFT_681972 [Pyrenochaeta sp. DS3sAY3a]